MKTTILTLALLTLFIVLLNYVSRRFLVKIIEEKENEIEENESVFIPLTPSPFDNIEEQKSNVDEKVVLSITDNSSSSNPQKIKDYNDKQNLNTKYNKNTYRSTNGRFKSIKKYQYE